MAQQPETITTLPTQTENTSEATTPKPLQSPFCSRLRSKKFYFLQQMPTEERHLLDATGHCWCTQTMQAIGPDGERALPKNCNAERNCYRSLFE